MKKLVIGDLVSRAWDLAVKHWPIFVLLAIITSLVGNMGVTYDSSLLTAMGQNPDPEVLLETLSEALQVSTPLLIISILLTAYLGYVMLNLYVNAYCTGRPYTSMLEAFKVDFNQLAIYFAVEIVYGLIVGLGTCLCILPGIWLAIRLWYAPLLAATQGASFGEAFSRSWEMTKGHFWELFLMGLTMIGICILGFCACFVGYFFAVVIIEFMLVISYFILKPEDEFDTLSEATDFVEVE